MASAIPIEFTKASTLSLPIDSPSLPEHSRNIKDIRDKYLLSGNGIEHFSKVPMIYQKRHSFIKATYAMVGLSNPYFSTLFKEVCHAKVGKGECFFYGGFDFWRSNDLPDFGCGR